MAEPREVKPSVMFTGQESPQSEDDRPASPREYYDRYFKPKPRSDEQAATDEKSGGEKPTSKA